VLATHRRVLQTLQDVIDAAKAKPDTLTYASVGAGSVGHLTMVSAAPSAPVIKMVHVPTARRPAMNDAIAGHAIHYRQPALVMPQSARQHSADPANRQGPHAVAADGAERHESGICGVRVLRVWGDFCAARNAEANQCAIGNGLVETLREPGILKQISENLQVTMRLGGPEEESQILRAQMDLWGPVVKENISKANNGRAIIRHD